MGKRKDLEINYSISNKEAVALNAIDIKYKGKEVSFFLPQFNYKLYRQNELDSQFNVYVSAGLGAAGIKDSSDADTSALGGITSLQADYETRRLYTLLLGEHLQTDQGHSLNRIRYRAGVAPYLTDFDGIHTWFITQVEYTPERDEEWTVTPLIRLFYQNYLIEAGSSTKGELFLAGIFHF
jgi:hypothetical protein